MSSDEEMLSWTKGQYTKVAAPEGRAVSSPPNPPRVHQPRQFSWLGDSDSKQQPAGGEMF